MTAFTVRDGLKHRRFQWQRLCLGLASAPALFQQLVEGIFKDLPEVLVYLDDIVIMTDSVEDHLRVVDEVLRRLAENHLVINPAKCQWMSTEVRYLGHKVSKGTIAPLPDYVAQIKSAPSPSTLRQARSFAGAIQWLHKYLPNCSLQLQPIQQAINQKPFKWTPEADAAYKEILGQLHGLQLGSQQEEGRLVLTTDASTVG